MEKKDSKNFGKKNFSKKGFHKGPFRKGPKGGNFRKKLEPGVEYIDAKEGVGIVRKVTPEGITVAFGDIEKIIPRKKPSAAGKKAPEGQHRGKPFGKRVFTFDVKEEKREEKKEEKGGIHIGLEVTDPVLGKGKVTRIGENTRIYITYEKTGETIMYPLGLTPELKRSAFPNREKENKADKPKGKGRTYTVPAGAGKPAARKAAKPVPHAVHEERRGNTQYFTLEEGSLVLSPKYGEGTITEIGNGKLNVAFHDESREFSYPQAFAEGELSVIVKK